MRAMRPARSQAATWLFFGFLRAYGSDWRDACVKCHDKVGNRRQKKTKSTEGGRVVVSRQSRPMKTTSQKMHMVILTRLRGSGNHIYRIII